MDNNLNSAITKRDKEIISQIFPVIESITSADGKTFAITFSDQQGRAERQLVKTKENGLTLYSLQDSDQIRLPKNTSHIMAVQYPSGEYVTGTVMANVLENTVKTKYGTKNATLSHSSIVDNIEPELIYEGSQYQFKFDPANKNFRLEKNGEKMGDYNPESKVYTKAIKQGTAYNPNYLEFLTMMIEVEDKQRGPTLNILKAANEDPLEIKEGNITFSQYYCPAGKSTIGYGATRIFSNDGARPVNEGEQISYKDAFGQMQKGIEEKLGRIKKTLGEKSFSCLEPNELIALNSFCYNASPDQGLLEQIKTAVELPKGDERTKAIDAVADRMELYVKIKNKSKKDGYEVSEGLVNRRKFEGNLIRGNIQEANEYLCEWKGIPIADIPQLDINIHAQTLTKNHDHAKCKVAQLMEDGFKLLIFEAGTLPAHSPKTLHNLAPLQTALA